jgi:hypothetical protein
MISLKFNNLQQVTEQFQVSFDTTPWDRSYVQTVHGNTPQRARASYNGITQVLHPTTPESAMLKHATGVYLVAFDLPTPALYVGIAAESAKNPEGILRRLRKHCIKAMGSNMGSNTSTGGVHHPQKWCQFAMKRHEYLNGKLDNLGDVRFTHAKASEGNHKSILQDFERLICSNTAGVLDQIYSLLWPGSNTRDVCLLTSGTVHHRGAFDYQIQLWQR